MNYVELSARLDPHYNMKMQHLRESVYAKAEIERFRANEAMSRESMRAGHEMDRERFRADRDDTRQERSFQVQRDIEDARGNNAISVEELRGRNALSTEDARGRNSMSLAQREHENMLARMEDDLQMQMTRAGFDSGLSLIQKMADEDMTVRSHITRQFEQRSQLRSDVFKTLMGAVIQEKIAQRQHARDMEKTTHESNLRRAEAYFTSVCTYVASLLDRGQEKAAKTEIDRLVREWERA